MTRRSLCAFVGAVLLAALADPVQAKPPDLPLAYQEDVTPRHEPVELVDYFVEQTSPGAVGYLMLEVGVPTGGTFTIPTLVPLAGPVGADVGNFEPKPPPMVRGFHCDYNTVEFGFQVCPVGEAMAKLRPSVRRRLAGALLFGVHPLLALVPVEAFFDFPCDHPVPVAFVGYQRCQQCPGCPYTMQQCQPCEPQAKVKPQVACPNAQPYPGCPDLVQQCQPYPCQSPKDEPQKTVCPYFEQQTMQRHAVQIADPAVTRTVLENLDRLKQATRLFREGQKLADQGRICEALDSFCQAQQMCPGRFEEGVSDTLNAMVHGDVEESHPGTTEEAEAPPTCPESGCGPCFQAMMHLLGISPPPCCPTVQQGCQQTIQAADETCEVEEACRERTGWQKKKPNGLTLAKSSVKKHLKVKVDVHYVEAPLQKVLEDVQALAGVDVSCTEEIDLDRPVTLEAKEVSLKKLLEHVLHEAGLEGTIEDGQVKVVRKRNTIAYAVGHLMPLAPCTITGQGTCEQNVNVPCALVSTITSQVAPKTWKTGGGQGTIDYDPATRSLVVTQTDAVHKQIADYLGDVCQLLHYAPEDETEDVDVFSCVPDESQPTCPEAAKLHEKIAIRLQVKGLLKACQLEMAAGRHERAAQLAHEAHALDPERVGAEPLVYKMHLLRVAGPAEECEPPARPCVCVEAPCAATACEASCKEEAKGCACKEKKCKEDCECCGGCPCNKKAQADCKGDCACCDRCGCDCCKKKPGSAEEAEEGTEVPFATFIEKFSPPGKRMGEIEVDLSWKGIRLKGAISVGTRKVHLRYEPRGTAIWVTPVDGPR